MTGNAFRDLLARRGCAVGILVFSLFVVQRPVCGRTTVRIERNGHDSTGCLSSEQNSSAACKTLHYALANAPALSDVDFLVGCGRHTLDGAVSLANCFNFLIGSSCGSAASGERTTVACVNNGSLAFHNGANIAIMGIAFENCGGGPYGRCLLFNRSRDVRLDGVDVYAASRGGVSFLDSYGSNTISTLRVRGVRGGPGLYVEFGGEPFCAENATGNGAVENGSVPSSSQCRNPPRRTEYTVRGSLFQNCRSTDCSDTSAAVAAGCGAGGGVRVVFGGSSADIAVDVEDSHLLANQAEVAGGGAFVAFLDQSSQNRVTFTGCNFTNNSASGGDTVESMPQGTTCSVQTTGGGVGVLYSNSSTLNTVKVDSCSLSNNSAHVGGGLDATFDGIVSNSMFKVARSTLSGNGAELSANQACNEEKLSISAAGSGGGLSVKFAQQSTKNLFTLFASNLSYNFYTANGGGLSIVHTDNSTFNEIRSTLNTFESNFMNQVASECAAQSNQSTADQGHSNPAEGGGLSIQYRGSTQANAASLWDLIIRNTATVGGGMFVRFEGKASNNSVRASGVMRENKLDGGSPRLRSGGGIMVEYFQTQLTGDSGNQVIISNALILQNNCENSFGGGVAIFQDSSSTKTTGQVIVSNCVFANNTCGFGRSLAALSSNQLSQRISQTISFETQAGLSIELYLSGQNVFLSMLKTAVTEAVSSISEAMTNVTKVSASNLTNEAEILASFENTIADVITETLTESESPTPSPSITQDLLRDGQCSIYLRSTVVRVAGTQRIRCGGLSRGVFSIDSRLTFDSTANLSISHCAASHGGAIALYGFSTLTVTPGSTLAFTANHALQRGGAIYVRTSPGDVSMANTCFLRYEDPGAHPEEWRSVRLVFTNNTAASAGSSIYIREGLTCLPPRLRCPLAVERQRVLKWDNVFTFHSPVECSSRKSNEGGGDGGGCSVNAMSSNNCGGVPQVNTGPHTFESADGAILATTSIVVCDNGSAAQQGQPEFHVIPGRLTPLPIATVRDMYDQIVSPSLAHSIYQQPPYDVSVAEFSDLRIRLRGTLPEQEPLPTTGNRSNFQLPQLIIQSFVIRELFAVFPVRLQPCPPSFVMNRGMCRCSAQNRTPYLLSCDDTDNLDATLRRNTWLGYVGSKAAYADCPVGYCTEEDTVLPGNASLAELDQLLCSAQHRTGVLCGACVAGFSLPINTDAISPECVSCDNLTSQLGLLIWFAAEWLPILVVMTFILLFNIDLFDGRFNSFLLFAQIVPGELVRGIQSASRSQDYRQAGISFAVARGLLNVLNFLNLSFFNQFLPKFCLTRNATLSILHISLLRYAVGLLPLLLVTIIVVIEVVGNKCCRPVRVCLHYLRKFKYKYCNSPSYDRAITSFYILGYSRFLTVSVEILNSQTVHSVSNGESVAEVLYLDGNIPYLSSEHYTALFPAIFVILIIVAVPTLFLIFYPTVPMIFEAMKKSRYKALNWVEKLTFVETAMHRVGTQKWIKHYLDVCQGCFSYKYRIFASLFFLYRIILLGLRQYLGEERDLFLIQLVLILTLFTAIAIFQPYEKPAHNATDTIILGILTLLYGMNLFSDRPTAEGDYQILLIMLVFIYPVGIFALAVFRFFKRCRMHTKKSSVAEDTSNDGDTTVELTSYHTARTVVSDDESDDDSSELVGLRKNESDDRFPWRVENYDEDSI